MNRLWVYLFLLLLYSCKTGMQLSVPQQSENAVSGTEFYKEAAAMNWKQRDSFAVKELLSGNLPSFFKKFVPVHVSMIDSSTGKTIRAVIYVSPDYISIGTDADWARIPLTPMAAQQIADSFHCFLPTKKMVDEIFKAATIKSEPVPMYAFRDSTPTMYQHHLMIEGQRKQQKGLIAGIKKDVILTEQVLSPSKQNKVAIYGWHQLNGKPIQPVYTGHANWYVDYSHGIRLIYEWIKINGKWVHYKEVFKHPVWYYLLTDETHPIFVRYPL
ncbi:MAG: hypothetical protein QM725_08375 [Lacibacter sp.]